MRDWEDSGLSDDDLAGDDVASDDVKSDAFGTCCWDDSYAFVVDIDGVIAFPYFCGFPPTTTSPGISSVFAMTILHEIFISELLNSYCLSIFDKSFRPPIIAFFHARCLYRDILSLLFPLLLLRFCRCRRFDQPQTKRDSPGKSYT